MGLRLAYLFTAPNQIRSIYIPRAPRRTRIKTLNAFTFNIPRGFSQIYGYNIFGIARVLTVSLLVSEVCEETDASYNASCLAIRATRIDLPQF